MDPVITLAIARPNGNIWEVWFVSRQSGVTISERCIAECAREQTALNAAAALNQCANLLP